MLLKRYFHAYQQSISERVTMNEIHIVLLDKGKFPAVLKHIVVFKTTFYPKKELTLCRPELGTKTEAEHPVLIPYQTVLIYPTTIPIIAFPKTMAYRCLPMVTHLSEHFHSVAIGKRMLVADCGVQRGGEQEAGIYRQLAVLCECANRCHRTDHSK